MNRRLTVAGRVIAATAAAVAAATTLLVAPVVAPAPMLATAAADCPNVQVVFARGTNEPPGIGRIGDAFVDALRSQVGAVDAYAVNYPATYNFLAAADGANDASNHIQEMADTCPGTKMVLGGYSQGAAVVDVIAAAPIGGFGFTAPLPDQAAEYINAVAVFGNPSTKVGRPLTASPGYGAKTIDLCADGDPVCSPGQEIDAHKAYVPELTNEAARFVAGLL
jgi:cutinase